MKSLTILLTALLFSLVCNAQSKWSVAVKDARSLKPLTGATVAITDLHQETTTDENGAATFQNIPSGLHHLKFSFLGYSSKYDSLAFFADTVKNITVLLEPSEAEELNEVVISSTRSSRTIANIPTRIEFIAGEELDEKGNMKPGDIRMLLNETTGIQTQQTSATSANAAIRIQGLDGRYTQILKDGFPLYSGAASGLSLLQTPPLDLKQVEIIKGSSSTLYGAGAIAGLINLITKTPKEEKELKVHVNGTTAGGLDLNGFYGQRFGKTGLTVFAARNSNQPYAAGNDNFTAIPEFSRYTFNPKLFLEISDKMSVSLGINSSFEQRLGGDLQYINGKENNEHSFFERNNSDRLSSQFSLVQKSGPHSQVTIKNSVSYFNRKISVPSYQFNGSQYSTFTELGYHTDNEKTEWVGGLNLWTDQFKENKKTLTELRNYNQTTFGAFVQNNLHAATWLDLETGFRSDLVANYGIALLPRVSALFKITPQLNSRIGGGLGYKTPTIFNEESERIQYRNVLAVASEINKLEKSYGANWDIDYHTSLLNDQISLGVNHMFFYTILNDPLTMKMQPDGNYRFLNPDGKLSSKGMETNVKLTYDHFKLFVGYSFTDAEIQEGTAFRKNPLTSKQRLNNVLMYEVEDKWKLGFEAYYYGKQTLTDGSEGKAYQIFGFMAEKLWERFSLYLNFENFTDTRQTRFDTTYTGTVSNPIFRDIYAPLDGFVVNGGLKIRL